MTAIIKYPQHILNAQSFIDRFSKASPTDYLYVGIGKSTAWAGGDTNPTAPTDTENDKSSFWSDLQGIQRVEIADIMFVLPRTDWVSGTDYNVFDPSDVNAYTAPAEPFYVYAEDGVNYNMYSVNTDPATPSTIKPTGTTSTVAPGDGYVWNFLYDLNTNTHNRMLLDNWVPVNYSETESTQQAATGDVDAYRTLGSKWVMIFARLPDAAGGGLTDYLSYRKVGLISNPVLVDGVTPATASKYEVAELQSESGKLLHLEHREPNTRAPGQTDDIKIILEF